MATDAIPAHYPLFERIASYPLVSTVVTTTASLYGVTKNANPLLKRGFEVVEGTIETYGYVCDPVLSPLDAFGCRQLDKLEEKVQQIGEVYQQVLVVKDNAITAITSPVATVTSIITAPPVENAIESAIDYSTHKLQDTLVGSVLDKTLTVVESVIDTVLPPTEVEVVAEGDEARLTVLERKSTIIRKLRKRTTVKSLSAVPSNAVTEGKLFAVRQAKQSWQTASTSLENLTDHLLSSSTKDLARESYAKVAEPVYRSLDSVTVVVASMLIWAKRFDVLEPIVTIQALAHMISRSKTNVLASVTYPEFLHRLRTDTVHILHAAAELLVTQLASGKEYMSKSDYTAITSLVALIDSAISKIADNLPSRGPKPLSSPSRFSKVDDLPPNQSTSPYTVPDERLATSEDAHHQHQPDFTGGDSEEGEKDAEYDDVITYNDEHREPTGQQESEGAAIVD